MAIHTPSLTANSSPTSRLDPADVVLVHDYLLVMRGAERTFQAIAGCYPGAEVATLLYDPRCTNGRFAERHVRTSFLQPFAADQRRFRRWLPLLPLAAERLSVKDAQVVISSSSAFAHGVRPAEGAVHVCYCHSPFRYIWHERDGTTRSIPLPLRPSANAAVRALRRWDLRAAAGVTRFVANSEITRRRIGEFYGRDATVVHPPVDIDRFTCEPDPQDYFLSVGEVTRHKNTELALAAAERAGVAIKLAGQGPDLDRLRARYPRAEFLGRVDDRRLAELYAGCRALVVPAIEEFGITIVEALAAGRPVLASAAGGALETMTDGETGILVKPRSVDALAEALRGIDWECFEVARLRAVAEGFSESRFRERLVAVVSATIAEAMHAREPYPDAPNLPASSRAVKPAAGLAALNVSGG